MKKKVFVTMLVAVFLAAIFLWTAVLPIRAQSDSGISQKLSKMLDNQKEIISRLAEIKDELNKIKFRL